MKGHRQVTGSRRYFFLFAIVVFSLIGMPASCLAQENAGKGGTGEFKTEWQESLSLDEVQNTFEDIQGGEGNGTGKTFSMTEFVSGVLSGEVEFSFRHLWQAATSHIQAQFDSQKQTLLRILLLGILSGVFLNFAGTVGDKDLSETGFYVTFLLLMVTMSAGFATVTKVATEAVENLLDFMKVLIPSFSLSLCFGTGTGTSLACYETMLIAISILETVMLHIFLPGVQVYFMLSMVNQLADHHFSKLAGLVKRFLKFGIRLLFGILIGYQGIQGMLLPIMDKVKGNALLRAAKGLPGIGNSIGGVADTVVGSGMLIKSAVGVGGILCILVLCFYPILKLFVFQLIYRIGSAFVQPVSDMRVVAALQTASECGGLLLKYVFAGAVMFVLSITIVVVSTNLTM